jgi:predicted Zn-dependent protease
MSLRRLLTIPLMIALLCASIPAPAFATSTAQEVQIGKEQDKQITDSTNVVTDPLLNAWVNDVSQKLWTQVARKDVPYNIKILDVTDINAFSTLGGYIYINEGTLDFVQSDDELASVIGHETGHIERRHTLTMNTKVNVLNLLFTVASLFSPIIYRFGQLAEAGIIAKASRADELEADKYGLLLMSRAGYDPDAMVSFMNHMNVVIGNNHDLVSKYLQDHPDFPDRISHLVGYPELDPTVRTDDQRIAAATHNLETARYNIAALEFGKLQTRHPDNTLVTYQLGASQLALGETAKGEQNLSQAATLGTPQTKALAQKRIATLRSTEKRLDLLRTDLQPLRDQMTAAQANLQQAATAILTRRDSGRDQLKILSNRIQDIGYEVPQWLGQMQPRPNTRMDVILRNLNTMSRSLDTALQDAQSTIGGVGSLERNKQAGELKENSDTLDDMNAPLKLDAAPPVALATFAYYPRMLGEIQNSNADLLRAVDAGRASLALLDVGLGDLDRLLREFQHVSMSPFGGGDIAPSDYARIEPIMTTALNSLNKAAVAASQAQQLYMMARSRTLEVKITQLGIAQSPDRYSTLQHALDLRFHNAASLDYDTLIKDDLSPGEATAAAIVAADTNTTPEAVIGEAQATHRSIVDIANARQMHAEALEIFEGLIWLDYTDDPEKETHLSS